MTTPMPDLDELEALAKAVAQSATCFICREPIKDGDMVLDDVSGGVGHRDCYGNDRDGFVKDIDTGEPLGPNDPLPTGYRWSAALGAEPVALKPVGYLRRSALTMLEEGTYAVVYAHEDYQTSIPVYLEPPLPTPAISDEAVATAKREIGHFLSDRASGYVNGISKQHLRNWLAALEAGKV